VTVGARVLGGRYRLGSVLGQGGMAVVYRAEDTMLGRTVAVKVLREQLGAEHEFLERFNREARAAARLNHPNIILVYDVGQDGLSNYIVMEYVEGEDLREQVRKHGALPPERVIDLGCQIAAALEYAHRKGLIHRDVKSQNVLLTTDGKVKVADFGIAVALGESSITADGMVVGSVHYMSPEQAEGRPTTPASDVYSLGVLLYELATGQLPFSAESPLAVARLQIEAQPVPPQRLNPGIPQQLAEVILACMAKDPAERPASAALVAAALRGQRSVSPPSPANLGNTNVQQGNLGATAINSALGPVMGPAGAPPISGRTGQQAGRQSGQQPEQPYGTTVLPGTVRRPVTPEQSAGAAGNFPQTDVLTPPDRRIGQRAPSLTRREQRKQRGKRRVWPWVLAAIALSIFGVRLGVMLADRVSGVDIGRNRPTPAPVVVATAAPPPTQAPAKPTIAAKPVAPTAVPVLPTAVPASPTAAPQPTSPPQPSATAPPPATATVPAKPTTPPAPTGLKTVPMVVGRSVDDATKAIQAAGLTVKAVERDGLNVANGQVTSQDPPANNPVLEGSMVTIIVSRGNGGSPKPAPKPGLVLVPNVEGMDEKEARSVLEGQGFKVVSVKESNRDRKGQVINQNPEAGNSVQPGVQIRLAIGN
jgi:serine/threonine protein kinase